MIDQGVAITIAAAVALTVGLIGLFTSLAQSKRAARATVVAQLRSLETVSLVSLVRLVELSGIAIQDRIFNLTEAENSDPDFYEPGIAPRDITKPSRAEHAEASALVAAYGDRDTQSAFLHWTKAVDAWEVKLADLAFEWDEGNRGRVPAGAVQAERDGERESRNRLGQVVNKRLTLLRGIDF